jgi:hypothetical protein
LTITVAGELWMGSCSTPKFAFYLTLSGSKRPLSSGSGVGSMIDDSYIPRVPVQGGFDWYCLPVTKLGCVNLRT